MRRPASLYEYARVHGLRAPVRTRPFSIAGLRFALIKAFGFSQIVLAAYVVYASLPEYTQDQLHHLPQTPSPRTARSCW